MKLYVLTAALTFLVGVAHAENSTCSFSSPAGTTQIQVLETNQFVVHTPHGIQTIYSCGTFVNDGSVVLTPATEIVELASQNCAQADYPNLTYIIYCH